MSLYTEPVENELNLEKIDMEIRMEKIRQNASKLTWDGFGQAVRRNLLEKRMVFDADGRIDVIQAISYMKKHIHVNSEANESLSQKIKQLAESLESTLTTTQFGFIIKNSDVLIEAHCSNEEISSIKISYWNDLPVYCEEALKLLKNNEFTEFRDRVFKNIQIISLEINENDRIICRDFIYEMEREFEERAGVSEFSAINNGCFGYYLKREALRAGRLYYLVEPTYIQLAQKFGRTKANMEDLEILPYIEISIVPNDKKEIEVERKIEGPDACICVKFSRPFLFSHLILKRIEHMMAKSPLVRHYTNLYRYMTGLDKNMVENVQFKTNLKAGNVQHCYKIDVNSLTKENDAIIVELYIKNMGFVEELLQILRDEWMHNSLWESINVMCFYHQNEICLPIHTKLTRQQFEFVFQAENNEIICCKLKNVTNFEWKFETKSVRSNEATMKNENFEKIDGKMTEKLNRWWNIPAALSILINHVVQFRPSKINKFDFTEENQIL